VTDDRRAADQRREQEVADRALREFFAGRPRPDLPPFFAARCAARVDLTPSIKPLGRRWRIALRAYWVLTLIIGGGLLARTEWPPDVSPAVSAGLLLSMVVTAVPVVFFAHLRGGLFELLRRVAG
jgi:hypothetical protein